MSSDNSLITVFIIVVILRIIFYQILVISFIKIIFYMKGFVEFDESFFCVFISTDLVLILFFLLLPLDS